MKKLIITTGLFYFLVCLSLHTQAQTKGIPLFIKTSLEILETVEKNNLQTARVEYDMIYSKKQLSWRTLYSGNTYQIMAYADENVKDLDIAVYAYEDGQWKRLARDSDEKQIASVVFTPDETQEYKIELSVYEFAEGKDSAKYCLLYLIR